VKLFKWPVNKVKILTNKNYLKLGPMSDVLLTMLLWGHINGRLTTSIIPSRKSS